MPQYRIGLIGCGWIAHFYARILPSLQERAEVAWVADLEAPRAGEIARQTGGKTLAEERAKQADALKDEITETPLVKTILTLFPGSKIEAIKPSDAGSHHGNLHINEGNEPPMTDEENGE